MKISMTEKSIVELHTLCCVQGGLEETGKNGNRGILEHTGGCARMFEGVRKNV
jgi:hypothetical protein